MDVNAIQLDHATQVNALEKLLKLKTYPVALKRYESKEAFEDIRKLKRPSTKLNMDQVIAQSRWLGYTIGVTVDDLMSQQCSAVVGLAPRNKNFLKGPMLNGVWFSSQDDTTKHQESMCCADYGKYHAIVSSPYVLGRIVEPELVLVYATPGQMILLINALQWKNYEMLEFSCVGESACADSWGRAFKTGKPAVSIPCYAERKFGGVQDDELLIAIPQKYIEQIIIGLVALSKNGLKYPIPNHGINKSPLDSMIESYG